MANIRNTTLLYRPSLSIWSARKKDKSESLKVNAAAGAVDGAANVNKQLLPDSPELLAVTKWATSFRTWVYTSTLPWDDSGWRAGRVDRHMDFMAEAGDKMAVGQDLVNKFIETYEQAKEVAKFQLANMFNESDYPGVDEVRRKFAFNLDVSTMPNADDFRVVDGVEQAEVDRLIQVATSDTEARIAAAMADAHERLYEVVAKMASTLTQYGNKSIKKFNDSLIGNISAVVAVMPALNLTNDPKLTVLCDRAKELCNWDLKDLRTNDAARDMAIRDAQAVVDLFKGVVDAPAPVKTTVTRTADVALIDEPSDAISNEEVKHAMHADENAADTFASFFSDDDE